jgi:hypothetical protein
MPRIDRRALAGLSTLAAVWLALTFAMRCDGGPRPTEMIPAERQEDG